MATRETPWPAGTPCWLDIMVPDVDAALEFYGPVVGWTFAAASDPGAGDYRLCQVDGRSAAGIGKAPSPDIPVAWTIYFASEDVDASVKLVNDNGGTVLMGPMDVGDVCRIAVATDDSGAVFGLFGHKNSIGTEVSGVPGALVWESGQFADPAKARNFYAAVFGHTFAPIGDMDLDMYCAFQVDGQDMGGLGGMMGEGRADVWAACVEVADVDTAVATARKLGGTIVTAAEDTPYGRMSTVTDPWGGTFVAHGQNNDPSVTVQA